MTKTKLGSTSRFGARYSTPLKQVVRDIETVQKKPQKCPQCGRSSLRRKGNSRWECRKCGAVMAGGAFEPRTGVGILVERIVRKGEKLSLLEAEIEKEKQKAKGAEAQAKEKEK